MRRSSSTFALIATASLACVGACEAPGHASSPPERYRYDLACDSMSVNGKEPLLCVRVDSATGAAWLIDTNRLIFAEDLLKGPAAHAASDAANAGRYAIECDGTQSPTDAAFRCLRLDRVSGEVAVVPLKALPPFPEPTPAEAGALQPAAVAAAPSVDESENLENQQP